MKAALALLSLTLALATTPAAAAPTPAVATTTPAADVSGEPTAAGFWLETDDQGRPGAWFYFAEVKGRYEGRIVKMFPLPGKPMFETCPACRGDQKDAPMLGLTIVKGMRRNGLKYEGGAILDPRNGDVYQAQMEVSPDGQQLSVRGYLGIPLLGQTQVWTRLPDDSIAEEDIPEPSVSPDVQQ